MAVIVLVGYIWDENVSTTFFILHNPYTFGWYSTNLSRAMLIKQFVGSLNEPNIASTRRVLLSTTQYLVNNIIMPEVDNITRKQLKIWIWSPQSKRRRIKPRIVLFASILAGWSHCTPRNCSRLHLNSERVCWPCYNAQRMRELWLRVGPDFKTEEISSSFWDIWPRIKCTHFLSYPETSPKLKVSIYWYDEFMLS